MTIKISDIFPKMTLRQREVCQLLLLGYSNKRIGHVLEISSRTVEDHRSQIFKKAEVTCAAEIALKLCGSPEILA
jgi:DNA-binding NarL/FixJ family response regulator